MKKINKQLNRRNFLKGAANTALMLPQLSSLNSFKANAAGNGRVKRVILIPTLYGIDHRLFFPKVQAAQQTKVAGAVDMYTTSLSQFGDNMSQVFASPFNDRSLRGKMNLYEGLDVTCGRVIVSHTRGGLAGIAEKVDSPDSTLYSETIDNIIARSPNFYSGRFHTPVFRIGTYPDTWSYDRKGGSKNIYGNLMGDQRAFDHLFANVSSNPTPPANPTPTGQGLIVDNVLEQLNSLKNGRRISSTDRQLLDLYAASMHELQTKIGDNQIVTCSKPNIDFQQTSTGDWHAFPGDRNGKTWGIRSTKALLRNYNEIIKNAFLCDLTRVVVLNNIQFQDTPVMTKGGAQNLFHSHDDGSGGPLTTAQKHKWFIDIIAELAQMLDATPDPLSDEGSLLDNSIIMFTNEHGGPGAFHNCRTLPTFTIGSLGDTIKTGYHIDTRRRPFSDNVESRGYIGRPSKQLLISIMNGVGLSFNEYNTIGVGRKMFGQFVETDGTGSVGYGDFKNTHNERLPFIHKN